MNDKAFNLMIVDMGILGNSLLIDLINKGFLITVVDYGKITFEDVSSCAYSKKYYGRKRIEILKEKFGTKINILNKSVFDLEKKDLIDVDLIVSTSDNFNLEKNNHLNHLALEHNIKLLTARLIENNLAEVGPLIIPHQTACFKCYETRIRSNLKDADNYLKKKIEFGNSEKLSQLATLAKIDSAIIELEIEKTIFSKQSEFLDKVITIDLNEYSMSEEQLFRIPNCPVCELYGNL